MIRLTLSLRIVLIVCAVLVLLFIIRRIKKSKIDVTDSIFLALLLVEFCCIGSFSADSFFLCRIAGFQGSANYVLVYVIAVLVMRDFSNTTKIAVLRKRVEGLIQEVALRC